MNVYEIKVEGDYQIHCVVAKTMGDAERIYRAKYWPCTITAIKLHSEYVQIQDFDEQKKE